MDTQFVTLALEGINAIFVGLTMVVTKIMPYCFLALSHIGAFASFLLDYSPVLYFFLSLPSVLLPPFLILLALCAYEVHLQREPHPAKKITVVKTLSCVARPRAAKYDACAAVFATKELRLMIYDNLPDRKLLQMQMVCKYWRDDIKKSVAIQQRLFLSPVPDRPGIQLVFNNTILQDFHPILCQAPDKRMRTLEDMLSPSWGVRRRAYTDPNASWRRMYITQPPLRQLDWFHTSVIRGENPQEHNFHQTSYHFLEHMLGKSPCVTIGMLYDFVEARLRRGCYTRVHYHPMGGNNGETRNVEGMICRLKLPSGLDRFWRPLSNPGSLPAIHVLTKQLWPSSVDESWAFDRSVLVWGEGYRKKSLRVQTSNLSHLGCLLLLDELKEEKYTGKQMYWSQSRGFKPLRLRDHCGSPLENWTVANQKASWAQNSLTAEEKRLQDELIEGGFITELDL